MLKNTVNNYASLVKFSHTILAMPFAVLAYTLAITKYSYDFDIRIFIYIILCMIFARNSAMAFNRYIDRDIDKKNPRTSKREIPQNIISTKQAIFFIIINSIFFIVSAYFINFLSFILSPIALFIVLFYSFSKRFTSFSHIILGISLSIAPAGAFIAVASSLYFPVIIISALVLFWTAGFDIIYSLQDEQFDRNNNLFSIPSRFGVRKAMIFSRLFHTVTGLLSILIFFVISLHYVYLVGCIIFCSVLLYQHYLIRNGDFSRANFILTKLNGFASITYSGLTVVALFLHY